MQPHPDIEGQAELAAWKRVAEDAELQLLAREAFRSGSGGPAVAAVARLRERWDADLVRIALQWMDARDRAAAKFSDAQRLTCDRQGVEQATSESVGRWKAGRVAGARGRPLFDLCSGIGGDAMAFAAALGPERVHAVDRSPVRAWMAERNARCRAIVADVTALPPEHDLAKAYVHLDPARREEERGSRPLTPIHVPPLEACAELASRAAGAAIKLGPGLEPAVLPMEAGLEWISERGTLVQLVAWCGELAAGAETRPGERRATMVDRAGHVSLVHRGTPPAPPCRGDGDMGRFLFVPDPALERSRLHGVLAGERGLAEPVERLGLLTGDEAVTSPWLAGFEILERLRPEERRVAAALRALGAGEVRVRTRGGSADADAWTRSLRRGLAVGGATYDVFLLRLGAERAAFVTRATSSPVA